MELIEERSVTASPMWGTLNLTLWRDRDTDEHEVRLVCYNYDPDGEPVFLYEDTGLDKERAEVIFAEKLELIKHLLRG